MEQDIWVLTICLVDTECYAEGPYISVTLHSTEEKAIAAAQLWCDDRFEDEKINVAELPRDQWQWEIGDWNLDITMRWWRGID